MKIEQAPPQGESHCNINQIINTGKNFVLKRSPVAPITAMIRGCTSSSLRAKPRACICITSKDPYDGATSGDGLKVELPSGDETILVLSSESAKYDNITMCYFNETSIKKWKVNKFLKSPKAP